ncbi:hypothetical protein F5146DRAFT_1122362 [Armillaria mellea]|nr:hypothetical protein F5146DRAFT_1122362 [Armillaria mellea]
MNPNSRRYKIFDLPASAFCTLLTMRLHNLLCLRLGVTIIAGLTFLGNVFIAAAGWINVKDILNHPLVLILPHQKIVWITAGLYTLLALVSLRSICGIQSASEFSRSIQTHAVHLTSFAFSSLFIGFIALFELHSKQYDDEVGANCKNTENGATMCRTKVTRRTISGILYLIWLTQFCTVIWLGYLVVHGSHKNSFTDHRYVQELRRQSTPVNYVAVKLQDTSASAYSPA